MAEEEKKIAAQLKEKESRNKQTDNGAKVEEATAQTGDNKKDEVADKPA